MTCLACEVLEGRIQAPGGVIYEDEHWVLDHSISPVLLKGWLILKPRRHVESFSELVLDAAAAFGPIVRRAAGAVERAVRAERVYFCSMGEEVRHLHVHVLPRYPATEERGPAVLTRMWSEERPWACSDEEAAIAAGEVRRAWR